MAKNCFLLSLLFIAPALSAQVKIGLMGGPQSASVTEKNSIAGWDTAGSPYYSPRSGFHVGIMSEIPLGVQGRFFFEPAVLYTQKGRNYQKSYQYSSLDTFNTYSSNRQLAIQYIEIPLNFAVKLPLSRKKTSSFLLEAGPYLSLFYNGKTTINENNQYSSSTQSSNNVINTTNNLEVGNKENGYHTFGYGVNGRAGFEFGNVTLTGFISQGLDNFYTSSYPGTFHHRVVGASLGIWLGQTSEAVVPKDRDKDGIPDSQDACPLEAGTALTKGCPDRDGDGIADKNDRCPDQPGTVKYKGCPVPDTDHDGINDELDKCPTVAGIAKYGGCPVPDTDHDGINDELDKCPTVAGLAKYGGCPVPDTDHDGISDELDKCPDQPGSADNGGCPVIKEETRKQVNYAAENIFFATNSADLLSKSFASLDAVAAVLRASPALRLEIDGYTDNTGTEAINLAISEKRAQSVKTYLESKGISPDRIGTKGFGPARPIAGNDTPAGRRKNRRVELKLK